jgi:competence transcription factor ComK
MKNANVFVDVDMTLIDGSGQVLDGAVESLQKLKERGCHLFLWSSVGMEYARSTAQRLEVTDLFEGFSSKPDIIIDDMPSTVLNPFVFDVHAEQSWRSMVDSILRKHID